jgi:23S rRNA (adenine2030-N6)-methyltransferase
MNYRHAYHAGNFADVLKHAVLALVIEHAKLKPAPFRVLDTHAGLGRYDLEAEQSMKTGEWQAGIGRLFGAAATQLPPGLTELLAPYLDVVRTENPVGVLRHYPGSALIARRLLRPQDRLIATELHPEDGAALSHRFARDPQTKIVELDGWLALKSFLPPKERRGVILIDPPYEVSDERDRVADGLAAAVRRFKSGTYLIWYPIKDRRLILEFHRALQALRIPRMLSAEILIRPARDPVLLNGCGLIIVNPPWTLPVALGILLPFLAQRMAREAGGGHALAWLAD